MKEAKNEQVILIGKTVKIIEYFMSSKKDFLCIYKMVNIIKETFENNDIKVIVDSVDTLWINEKNIEEKLGHKKLPVITNKY